MSLDSRKQAHMLAMMNKTFTGRQQTVVFAYQSGSSYSYVATSVIFRKQEIINPEIPTIAGAAPRPVADLIMIVPISISMSGLIYVADTSTATSGAVAAAEKYQPIEIVPVGIVPGGDRWYCPMRRLR